jgi:hypothetical protein
MLAFPFVVRLSRFNLSEARTELFYAYVGHVSVRAAKYRIAKLAAQL